MAEPPPEIPPTIPEIKQIAVCHGYGDSVADTLYALGIDGTIWVRSVRHDSQWQQMDTATAPVVQGWPARI